MKLSVPIFKLKREAKLRAREQNIPLHRSLDQIAAEKGYRSWSHLSSMEVPQTPSDKILRKLNPGDLMLLAARPNQGKTLFALQLLLAAIRTGRHGIFFSLEYTGLDVWQRIKEIGGNPEQLQNRLEVEVSDDICADLIGSRIIENTRQTVAIIDYLQLLDQKRSNPELDIQVRQLVRTAKESGAVIVALSQVHRGFELSPKPVPDLGDIRLPNPVDVTAFSKTCFLHSGEMQFTAAA